VPAGLRRRGYFCIGEPSGVSTLCIAEGFATGASIYEATGYPVAVAFDAGNLGPAAQALQARFPDSRLVLCADDDANTPGNPGLTKATEAARAVGGALAVPKFPDPRDLSLTDMNDLTAVCGMDAVREAIVGAEAPPEDLKDALRRLAALSSIEYDRIRSAEAKHLRVRVSVLDAEVKKEREKPPVGEDPGVGNRSTPSPSTDKGNGKAVAGHGLEGVAEFGEDMLAAKFTELHGEDWRYVDKWGKWVMWTLSRWLVDDTRAALHLVRLVCRDAASSADDARSATKLATRNTVSGVESLARGDRRHAMVTDAWDKDPYLLNALKGTVDLRTGALREHRREDYITVIAGATPQGECPGWMAFLDEITARDKEYQGYLQRMSGYMLTGDTSENALFFGHGPGGNGKSVFAGVLAAILGDYAATAPMDMFLEKKGESHPTELARLRGARLVLCTEIEKGRRWAEAKIKALTGGDRIPARFMRQDFFEYTPQFKLFVIGNHRPYISSVNEAIRRRLHLLPFTVTIPAARRDKKIQEKLLLEKDGILAWAFEGCLEWQIEGLNPPKCVVDATEEYFQEEDAVSQFLDEECEQISGAKVAIGDLFFRWKGRAEARGEYVGSAKGLVAELVTHGFKRCRLHGGVKGLEGLRLKPFSL
jgi:P4 family phage/plasmid primase-like protien